MYPSTTDHSTTEYDSNSHPYASALDQYDDAYEDTARRPPGKSRRPRRGDVDLEPSSRAHLEDAAALDPNWLPGAEPDRPLEGDRWSTFTSVQRGQRGPEPWPDWLVTERAAVDTELGILKTGKEADVFLVDRSVPGTDRTSVLAAKRYRDLEHSQFTRDAGYLAGRRVRKSRDQRAMDNKTSFGRQLLGTQWAAAEWGYLCRLWEAGAPVPYPVQIDGSELMMEYVTGPDGQAAPRLAQIRPAPELLADLWDQLFETMLVIAEQGWTHGDLSPFNLLLAGERLVLIDLPQVIDVVANPDGPEFLARDVRNVCSWFRTQGLTGLDEQSITADLLATTGMRVGS